MYTKYLKLSAAAVALTMIVSLFSAFGIVLHLSDNGLILCQIFAFTLCGIVSVFYMKKQDPSFKQFGFQEGQLDKHIFVFILVVVLIQPLLFGLNQHVAWITLGLTVLQMLLVSFVEESFFRGIIFYVLRRTPLNNVIFFSSLLFGLLHLASSLNPNVPFGFVILQIINALLLGVVFALIYCRSHSIYPVMLFHGLFNVFASLSNTASLEKNLLAVGVLSSCYVLFFIVYFIYESRRKRKMR